MLPFQAERILVVDDMDIANNGKLALDKISASPPDLVLLDAMMPGIDGYEVTRRIRQNDKLPFIPILRLTAYDDANGHWFLNE